MPPAPAARPRRRRQGGRAAAAPTAATLLLLLFLIQNATALAPSTSASTTSDPTNPAASWRQLLLRSEDPPVPGSAAVVRYPPAAAGFSRAASDADVAPLVRDNLDPDLASFREAAGRTRKSGAAGGAVAAAAEAAVESAGLLARLAAALRRATGAETAPILPPSPSPSHPNVLKSDWTGGPGLNVLQFEDFVARFDATVPRHPLGEGNAALVVFRNGSVSAHWLRGRDNHFRFACLKAAAESARALKFPDTAFLLNIDDFPVCRVDGGGWPPEASAGVSGLEGGIFGAGKSSQPPSPPTGKPLCPFPVLTNYKRWDASKNGSFETNEVLLPVLNHHYEDAYFFPWKDKRPKALMRASQQGCMPANSSRVALAVAAEREQAAAKKEGGLVAGAAATKTKPSSSSIDDGLVLDAGVVRIDGRDKHSLKRRFSKAGFVPIEDHAKWKFLVSADGCVAQTRLAKVLLANSVVLKEDSAWIEYYYRSLKPWVHYAPFRHRPNAVAGQEGAADGEVRKAVARLKADDAAAARVAAAGQRFAYRHLGQFSRLLYLRRLLVEYNALFGSSSSEEGGRDEMAAWVQGGGPERAVAMARARAAVAAMTGRAAPTG